MQKRPDALDDEKGHEWYVEWKTSSAPAELYYELKEDTASNTTLKELWKKV